MLSQIVMSQNKVKAALFFQIVISQLAVEAMLCQIMIDQLSENHDAYTNDDWSNFDRQRLK